MPASVVRSRRYEKRLQESRRRWVAESAPCRADLGLRVAHGPDFTSPRPRSGSASMASTVWQVQGPDHPSGRKARTSAAILRSPYRREVRGSRKSASKIP